MTSSAPASFGASAPPAFWRRPQPWLSLLVRLGLAAVALAAAWPKLANLRGSVQSVALYQLFPPEVNQIIGVALPIVELTLGLAFLTGLLTRYAAIAFGAMLVVFIAGIISAWARGLSIDCGCFAIGAELEPGVKAQYGLEILRDVGFLAMTAFLAIWPRSKASLDTLIGLNPLSRAARRQELAALAALEHRGEDHGEHDGEDHGEDHGEGRDGESALGIGSGGGQSQGDGDGEAADAGFDDQTQTLDRAAKGKD
ncbi:MAG: DoxX family membrane protein [Bifidobacteriaceae bacterium]|nr:DoxX family membrane protein [Bifidobacteriaceae bacterium]